MKRRTWIAALLGGALGTTGARAAKLSKADAEQARAVIRAQLEAFAADDADRAFSFATPSLREQFGSAQRFLEMVRTGYAVVYRPASVSFLPPSYAQGMLTQPVQMADADGAVWLAVYQLQRQPDQRWRIAGCDLVRGSGQMT